MNMIRISIRQAFATLVAAVCLGVPALAPSPALAASNHQSGLVNVNLQDVTVQAPISVAVPVGVAANVCDVNAAVLAQQAATGPASCTATSNSMALSTAVAQSMTSGGGSQSNNQSGLVNVNIQGLTLQAPISVAVPIGVAANVCDINAAVLASQNGTGGAVCTATSTSNALTQAIARSLMA